MSFFTGTPGKFERLSNLNPEQMGTYQNLTQQGANAFSDAGNYYRNLLSNDSQDFNAFAAPELRRFRQETIPDIAEQFAGAGSGALSSSGFRNSAVNAGVDLSERLGALRAQLRQQGAQGLQNIGNTALGNFGENVYRPARPGALDYLGQGIGQAAGMAAGYAGGNWLSNRMGQKQAVGIDTQNMAGT